MYAYYVEREGQDTCIYSITHKNTLKGSEIILVLLHLKKHVSIISIFVSDRRIKQYAIQQNVKCNSLHGYLNLDYI